MKNQTNRWVCWRASVRAGLVLTCAWAALGTAQAGPIPAVNLLQNGSFDSNNTGLPWSRDSGTNLLGYGSNLSPAAGSASGDGQYFAYLGFYNSYLSQTVTLSAGDYSLSWLDAVVSAKASYSVSLGGMLLAAVAPVAGHGLQAESLTFSLVQDTTADLVFARTGQSGRINASTLWLDDLVLTAVRPQAANTVPEPGSSGLVLLGLAAAGLAAGTRRRRG